MSAAARSAGFHSDGWKASWLDFCAEGKGNKCPESTVHGLFPLVIVTRELDLASGVVEGGRGVDRGGEWISLTERGICVGSAKEFGT